ncbi:hypothetical protein FB461_0426 [Rarobacter faecitabidus]|uniref:YgjP-like metallopeptidase domain-containing protein n=1 Tax=Rarobacter faecitabidus TaxID=13243 RepID=A0A542ZUD6_RARFA|nr:hypothetical protein FB461_0426 [Rarobacter faecitabidus]
MARVEVRRSDRRKRTISARLDGDTLVVFVPASLGRREEEKWVRQMRERMESRLRRSRPSDEELEARTRSLAAKYLPKGVRIRSVRWSDNQVKRWGSCSIETGDIRVSSRLRGMPPWVVDYVLLHEATHTIFAEHGNEFWTLLSAYPHTERARGFLQGIDYAGAHEVGGEAEDGCEEPGDSY